MVYEKYLESSENRDAELWMSIFHEDYEFLLHSDNKLIRYGEGSIERVVNLTVVLEVESRSCIYENDEIGIEHAFVTFSDGNQQAVMGVYTFKDGQVIGFETGATNISKD